MGLWQVLTLRFFWKNGESRSIEGDWIYFQATQLIRESERSDGELDIARVSGGVEERSGRDAHGTQGIGRKSSN